jgi:formylglycine-generating enzyme required for sulfatase activity
VVCVSFDDASAYAAWLSQTTGKKYRLLSEAEWQYLAGQVKSRPCASGNRADQSYKKAKGGSKALSCDDGFAMTAPVGRFEASAPGIYDIEGNVREWVADCANDSHAGRPSDQSARNSGGCGERMIMGSAWHSDSGEPAVIARRPEARKWRSNAVGFRVARELEPVAAAPR